MGLNVKQVMERLRVRSLEGLNLREALEALRRQMLRDGETMPTLPSTPAAAPKNPPSAAPASTSPRYFEEEDDDVTFTMDGDDALAEEFDPDEVAGMPGGSSSEAAEDLEDLEDLDALGDDDLDDVPDFGPPPSAAHASHAAHPPARRSAPAKAAPASSPPPSATEEPSVGAQPAASDASPTARRIAQLRTVRGGGAPTTHQRSAYRNVVVNELGEPEAVALVRGLWRVNPERLGPEQFDALISWGKRDTFAEEAADMLAALRAERQQAAAAAPKTPAAPTTPTTPTTPAASRPAPRSRAQQQPRAPTGGR